MRKEIEIPIFTHFKDKKASQNIKQNALHNSNYAPFNGNLLFIGYYSLYSIYVEYLK